MDKHTLLPNSRYEWEAYKFAADLLFDDYDLQNLLDCSITTVADCLGVNIRLAKYRMSTVEPTLYSE